MRLRTSMVVALVAGIAGLAACDGDGFTRGPGRITLGITDAPVDRATAVVVEFTGVELKPQNRDVITFDFDAPRSVDLLALQDGQSEPLLTEEEVPAGRYEWLRLKVNAANDEQLDSFITFEDGAQHELVVPSGAETGLKLVSGFRVAQGGVSAFTVDFDLRKSVHEPRNPQEDDFFLRPALRLLDNSQIGEISGTVDPALITAGCTPAVYVFSGADATPDDVNGTPSEPVTTALVEQDDTGHRYRVAFLMAGDYTVSFTCDAAADSPDTDEDLTFTGTQNATVQEGQTTVADFAPDPGDGPAT